MGAIAPRKCPMIPTTIEFACTSAGLPALRLVRSHKAFTIADLANRAPDAKPGTVSGWVRRLRELEILRHCGFSPPEGRGRPTDIWELDPRYNLELVDADKAREKAAREKIKALAARTRAQREQEIEKDEQRIAGGEVTDEAATELRKEISRKKKNLKRAKKKRTISGAAE